MTGIRGCREIAPRGLRTAQPAVLGAIWPSGPPVPHLPWARPPAGAEVRSQGDSPRGTHGSVAGPRGGIGVPGRGPQGSPRLTQVFLADLLEAGRPVDQPCTQAVRENSGEKATALQVAWG